MTFTHTSSQKTIKRQKRKMNTARADRQVCLFLALAFRQVRAQRPTCPLPGATTITLSRLFSPYTCAPFFLPINSYLCNSTIGAVVTWKGGGRGKCVHGRENKPNSQFSGDACLLSSSLDKTPNSAQSSISKPQVTAHRFICDSR